MTGNTITESKRNRAIVAELIVKASRDADFRRQFLADPKAQLVAAGAEFAAGVDIRAVENTEKLRYLVLPALVDEAGDLDQAQLAALAGGGSGETEAVTEVVSLYSAVVVEGAMTQSTATSVGPATQVVVAV